MSDILVVSSGFLAIYIVVKLKSSLWKFYGRHHDLVNRYGIPISQRRMDTLGLSQSQSHPPSRLTRRVTQWVWLEEKELQTLPKYLSSPSFFVGFMLLNLKFSGSLFVFLTYFFWSLCCRPFLELWLLIVTLASSNFSWYSEMNSMNVYYGM